MGLNSFRFDEKGVIGRVGRHFILFKRGIYGCLKRTFFFFLIIRILSTFL